MVNKDKFKVELGVEAMKKSVLDIFYPDGTERYDMYEGYFYLDEKGDAKFVVQEL